MSSLQRIREENSPYLQLIMLLFYAILGAFIFTIIAFGILLIIYGTRLFSDLNLLMSGSEEYLPALRIILIFTQLGAFLAPPFFLSLTEGKAVNNFYGFARPRLNLILIVILTMIVAMPILEWVTLINQNMVFPDFLKSVESWMRAKEDEAMATTLLLLKMKSIKDLIINLFMIALIPGIAEELMFRGGVQRTIDRIFKNTHVAIWVSAFIFSAIHVQFYGFLPRLLLGAGFGYLYFWSGSLWYSMLAHFINNGYAVCVAYYMQQNNMPLDEVDNTAYFAWYGYIISFILVILTFLYFKKQTSKTKNIKHL
ncbi:MAG: CPBP family intramembrane metalloprotease [Pedobacter sp.]|nr:MAG: CPBP family intramembrane metalloprotease [Pedobacter sp.]